MRRLVLAAAVLLLPAAVAAQEMMDPRQMSGIPRPDGQVPAGTLTVRMVAGELASWAPTGTPVHLVAMRGGDVKVTTAPVNDEGRAEFTGLATDGLTAYYALSLWGEDRLVAQPATLPPKVGVRMMLAGRKRDKSSGAPIGPRLDDEAQGHEGVSTAPALPPAGEVEILARGRVEPGAKIVVRELLGGTTHEGKLEGTGGMLTARLQGLPTGPDRVYVAELLGGAHRSSPFMLSPHAGARRIIIAYDQLLLAIQGGAQPEEQKMWFELSITVANLGPSPIETGTDGLLLPLAAGFRSPVIREEQSSFSIVPGEGVRHVGAIPPGQVTVTVQFALEAKEGRVAFEMPAPLGMYQSQIAIAKGPGTVVTSGPENTTPQVRRADDGREYFMLTNFTVAPGESLRFAIAGLPVPAAWQGWVKGLAAVAVLLLVGMAFAAALRRPPAAAAGRARPAASVESARRELSSRREKLFAELVALERARQAQRIDDDAFAAHRRSIMAKLVLVHRELDDLEGNGGQASA